MKLSAEQREQRLNALIASYLDAEAAGQPPNREAWLAKHPELATELSQFLDEHERLGRVGAPFRILSAGPGDGLLTVADAGGDQATQVVEVVRRFGDHELLKEIARGGMGVVFKARQLSLDRVVALKMVLAGRFATKTELERFRLEAHAAANLDHPQIVPIYEIGEQEGQHYFTMKLIEGPGLTDFVSRLTDDKVRQRWSARIVATVARAVHHAHQRGILHRDLKPGNLLLDASDLAAALRKPESTVPHVTDFGLAKRVGSAAGVTHTGAIVGTPAYMAPEQARGDTQLTTAIDIYSLGAILYELLTGRAPFGGDNPLEVMRQVAEHEPARPSGVNRAVQRDLETICLKCLEKAPERRYRSAEALADDLERWLEGAPIEARPSTAWERTVKWTRRRPTLAALTLLSVLFAAALLIGGTIFNANLQVALGQVEIKKRDLNEAQKHLDAAQKALNSARAAVARQEQAAAAANSKAQQLFVHASSLRLVAQSEVVRSKEPTLALLLAIEGARLGPRGAEQNNALAKALAECREIGPLLNPNDGHDVRMVHWFADEQRILTISWGTVRIWDVKSGKKLIQFDGPHLRISSFALSPDENWLALTFEEHCEHGAIEVNGQTVHQRFVVTDQAVRVYDTKSGLEIQVLHGHRHQVVSAQFSPDGQRLVTAGRDGTARIWDVASGTQLRVFEAHECGVAWAGFISSDQIFTASSGVKRSKDNPLQRLIDKYPAEAIDPRLPAAFHTLASGASVSGGGGAPFGEDLFACQWDANNGAKVKEFRTTKRGPEFPSAPRLDPTGAYLVAANLRDSLLLKASTAKGGVVAWDVVTAKETLAMKYVGDMAQPPVFSRDGKRVLLMFRAIVRVFDLEGGREIAVLHAEAEDFTCAHFSPDPGGQFVIAASKDATARMWEAATGKELFTLRGHEQGILATAFSPDGRRLVTGSDDRTARIWNIGVHHDYERNLDPNAWTWWLTVRSRRIIDAQEAGNVLNSRKAIWSAAISPDGKQVATGSFDGTLRLWDFATGKLQLTRRGYDRLDNLKLREGLPGEIFSIAYNHDGSRVLTNAADPIVRVFDGKSTREGEFPGVTYTPVRIYDTKSGEQVAALAGLREGVRLALFSPDSTRVLTIGDHRLATRSVTRTGVAGGSGTRNGTDLTARIFDATTGKQIHILQGLSKEIYHACWDATGAHICTILGERDARDWPLRVARIWDAMSGKQVLQISEKGLNISVAQFSPDGHRLLTWNDTRNRQSSGSGDRNEACVWDLATGKRLFSMKGTAGAATIATYSPDGKWIATGAYVYNSSLASANVGVHGRLRDLYYADRTTRLWDAESGALVRILQGHERSVHHIEFSKDSRWLVTASEDRTARVWEAATGKEFITLRGHDDDVKTAAISPDGRTVLTTSWDGTARLWPVDPLPLAESRKPRELSGEERARFALEQQ